MPPARDLGLRDGGYADRDLSTVRAEAAGQVADAEARVREAEQDATRARQAEAAAVTRAEHAQAAAADETGRIRADHQHALEQLTAATNACITALEETRDALRVRAPAKPLAANSSSAASSRAALARPASTWRWPAAGARRGERRASLEAATAAT
jgi:hypothetical protein